VAAHEGDAGALEPRDLSIVVPVRREAIPALEHGGRVERPRDRRRGTRQAPGRAEGRSVTQEGLRRHAGPVRALPADELRLHDHDGQAALRHPVGDVLADRAGADDDDVVLCLAHRSFAFAVRPRRMAETRKKTPPNVA